jgi:hypothetical protein
MFDDITKVYLWSDNGPHFHNNQFLNFIFLKNTFKNKVIEYNFFCEKHGKAVADEFFGCITNFLDDESMVSDIKNINELTFCLNNKFGETNNEYFFEMFLLIFINLFKYLFYKFF